MKNIITVCFLVGCMVLSIAGCGDSSSAPKKDANNSGGKKMNMPTPPDVKAPPTPGTPQSIPLPPKK